MSRYGSINVTGPASLLTRIVQSAEPNDLASRVNAAIAALPGGYVVVGITLAGGGDGHTFTVTMEAGAAADVTGGFTAPPAVACFLASEAEAMQIARAAAGPTSGPFADTQVAGSSKGTRFMGLVVTGDVLGGGGGGPCLTPLSRVYYVDGGTTTPLVQQNGSISCPFASIQQAIDAVPVRPPTVADQLVPWTFRIVPGFYDEDLVLRADGAVVFEPIGNPGAPYQASIAVLLIDAALTAPRNITLTGNPLLGSFGVPLATFSYFLFGGMPRVGDPTITGIVFNSCLVTDEIDGEPGGGRQTAVGLINGTAAQSNVTATSFLANNGGTVFGTCTVSEDATILNGSQINELAGTLGSGAEVGDSAVTFLNTNASGQIANTYIQIITPFIPGAQDFHLDNFTAGFYANQGLGMDVTLPTQQLLSSEAPSFGRYIVWTAVALTVIARNGVNPWWPNVYMCTTPAPGFPIFLPFVSEWYGPGPSLTAESTSRDLIIKNRGVGPLAIVPQAGETIDGVAAPLVIAPGTTTHLIAWKFGPGWETL
jgi:hypothetical protein